jgi:hypothetical protein
MIKTESKRFVIDSVHEPPKEVMIALHQVDQNLDLLWNEDDNQWEIYRIKQKGITRGEDVLCWQMSAPVKGLMITVGIADWLKKYDTNVLGMYDQDQMKNKFLSMIKQVREKKQEQKQKQLKELQYNYKDLLHHRDTERTQIVVPVTVGWNKKTGKPVRMVKMS